MIKVRLNISNCFRTLKGARRHVRIRSYISTLRKHNLPVLEYLRRALSLNSRGSSLCRAICSLAQTSFGPCSDSTWFASADPCRPCVDLGL